LILLRTGADPTRRDTLNPSRGWPSPFGRENTASGPRDSLHLASYTAEKASFPLRRCERGNEWKGDGVGG
jgi:hypothetical protein